jgi:hypothetical protein
MEEVGGGADGLAGWVLGWLAGLRVHPLIHVQHPSRIYSSAACREPSCT